jgi:hypothetical protein
VDLLSPAYIAGVTNPIFESGGSWDLLFDVGSGRVIVSKDIHTTYPPVSTPAPPILSRTGTFKAEPQTNGEDELGRLPGSSPALKSENVAKADSADNLFMEDVGAIILPAPHANGPVRRSFLQSHTILARASFA